MFELKLEDGMQLAWRIAGDLMQNYGCTPSFKDVVNSRDWTRVVSFQIDYEQVTTCEAIVIRQIQALFEKNGSIPAIGNLKKLALAKWHESELLCLSTNQLLTHCGTVSTVPRLTVLLEHMRRYIQRCLGRAPAIADLNMHFGPGATTGTKKKMSCPTLKMAKGIQCSERLARSPELLSLLREIPHWTAALPEASWYIDDEGWLCESVSVAIASSQITFVPKNYKSLRSICIEPALNGFLQQGLRHSMESRMRRFGLQTLDQRPSRENARLGSLDGSIATIDLSSASDTIATELVRRVFPDDWFRLLNIARSDVVQTPTGIRKQSKFCSMGNATTFPLETLVFAACCSFSCSDFTVYGDDICVPTAVADRVMKDLALLGFIPNMSKSFLHGPFRESCGADYLRGIDIRPSYLRSFGFQSLVTFHNALVKKFPELPSLATSVRRAIPRHFRLYGPAYLGDCVLHSDSFPVAFDKNVQRRKVDVWLQAPNTWVSIFPGDWVSPLYSVYVRETSEREQLRKKDGRPVYTLPGAEKWIRKSIYIN